MTADNTLKPSDSTESGQFSHIKVGKTADTPADDEEEEVVELGAVPRAASSAEGRVASRAAYDGGGHSAAAQGRHTQGHVRATDADAGSADTGARKAEDETDYGIDDLEPMPVAQKIVLLLVIIAIVVAGAWIFNYYVSGSNKTGTTSQTTTSQTTTSQTAAVQQTTSQATSAQTASSQAASAQAATSQTAATPQTTPEATSAQTTASQTAAAQQTASQAATAAGTPSSAAA